MIQKICKCCGPIGEYERQASDPRNCTHFVVPSCRRCAAETRDRVTPRFVLTDELLAAYSRIAAE